MSAAVVTGASPVDIVCSASRSRKRRALSRIWARSAPPSGQFSTATNLRPRSCSTPSQPPSAVSYCLSPFAGSFNQKPSGQPTRDHLTDRSSRAASGSVPVSGLDFLIRRTTVTQSCFARSCHSASAPNSDFQRSPESNGCATFITTSLAGTDDCPICSMNWLCRRADQRSTLDDELPSSPSARRTRAANSSAVTIPLVGRMCVT